MSQDRDDSGPAPGGKVLVVLRIIHLLFVRENEQKMLKKTNQKMEIDPMMKVQAE